MLICKIVLHNIKWIPIYAALQGFLLIPRMWKFTLLLVCLAVIVSEAASLPYERDTGTVRYPTVTDERRESVRNKRRISYGRSRPRLIHEQNLDNKLLRHLKEILLQNGKNQ